MDKSILERARERFGQVISQGSLPDPEIRVLVKTLTPEEAIGTPGRRDFPIVLGKERVIEAEFGGSLTSAGVSALIGLNRICPNGRT
jgi:hypothetical protein